MLKLKALRVLNMTRIVFEVLDVFLYKLITQFDKVMKKYPYMYQQKISSKKQTCVLTV